MMPTAKTKEAASVALAVLLMDGGNQGSGTARLSRAMQQEGRRQKPGLHFLLSLTTNGLNRGKRSVS